MKLTKKNGENTSNNYRMENFTFGVQNQRVKCKYYIKKLKFLMKILEKIHFSTPNRGHSEPHFSLVIILLKKPFKHSVIS